MAKIFRLGQSQVEDLAEAYGTPLLVVSLEQVKQNYAQLKQGLRDAKIHYAVKSNPGSHIIKTLAEEGSCFDVASDGEMIQLTNLGIAPEKIIYANPVKTRSGLMTAQKVGVNQFTFDSESEIGKIAEYVPAGKVLLRIRIDKTNALIDLNKKFGADPQDAIKLLLAAQSKGMDPAGLCFHVGSQTTEAAPYIEAIKVCNGLFAEAAQAGLNLRILDIGGGFPMPTKDFTGDISAMLGEIRAALDAYFPATEIWAEPGRGISGSITNLITRVIGKTERDHQRWYFLDEGLYGTFSGVIFDHQDYELETFKSGTRKITATFAGPSCDSLDVMFKDQETPELEVDDLIMVPACGAYTSASATTFNGFALAKSVIWEEVKGTLPSTQMLKKHA
jgi:ornithine decarboxylase